VARDGAHRLTVDVLTSADAVSLLAAIAGKERIDLVGELSDERDRLNVLTSDGDEHMAVRSVFSWSYRQLPREVARLFRLLGLHAGADFSVHASAALANTSAPQARRLLDALAAANLLEQTANDRYRFHDLLRVYAAERAETDEPANERAQAVRLLLTWYLQTADATGRVLMPRSWHVTLEPPQASCQPLVFTTHADAVQWCEAERANLVAATQQAANVGEHVIAWQLPAALMTFYLLGRHWADWLATHEVGLAASRHLHDHRAEGSILTRLGMVYQDLRRFDQALACCQSGLARWQEIGDRKGEAWTVTTLATNYLGLRQINNAIDTSRRALAIAQEIDEPTCESLAMLCLSVSHQHLRRYEDALDYSQRALAVWTETTNWYGQGWTLNNLGTIYRHLGRFDDAIAHCHRALITQREIGDRKGEASTLNSLGKALLQTGNLAEARKSWSQALEIFDSLGDPKATAVQAQLEDLSTDSP
jgi:tetratricopeptide (TPR) repeat protein